MSKFNNSCQQKNDRKPIFICAALTRRFTMSVAMRFQSGARRGGDRERAPRASHMSVWQHRTG